MARSRSMKFPNTLAPLDTLVDKISRFASAQLLNSEGSPVVLQNEWQFRKE